MFTNRSGVLYGQKMADPALLRIGLNIVRRLQIATCNPRQQRALLRANMLAAVMTDI